MKKSIRICVLILLLFTFWNCEKPLTQLPSTTAVSSKGPFSVDEARQWFESKVSVKAAKSSRTNGAWNKELVWEFVNNIDSGDVGQVMVVPIRFKDGIPLISIDKQYKPSRSDNDVNFASRLVIWKDQTGEFQYRVHDVIPDEDSRKKNGKKLKKEFSGYIMISDFEGAFLEGYKYRNGKITGKVSEGAGNRTTSCQQLTVDHWSVACVNGSCYEPQYMYTETKVLCEEGDHGSDGITPPPGVTNPTYVTNHYSSNGQFVMQVSPGPGETLNLQEEFKCFGINSNTSSIFRIVVYVDQAIPGYRSFNLNSSNGSPGHTYLGLEEYSNGQAIIRNVGYYPDGLAHPFSPTKPGKTKNDERAYDVSLTITVTREQFESTLMILRATASNDYNLDSHNCTHYAVNACSAAGVSLPQTVGTWWNGGGLNPSDMAEDIRSMPLASNMTRSVISAYPNSPQGACN